MKTLWPDFAYDMYKRACNELNYPEIPFGKYIKEFIRAEDIVVDIGCGIGIPAMYISKLCTKVIAVDQDRVALNCLDKDIINNDIKNIQTVYGAWPDVNIQPCDAAVSFYASGIAKNKEGLIALINAVKRGGIITSNGTIDDGGFFKGIADRLGVKSRKRDCNNGCYLKGGLEALGCRVKCEQITHDFGQPVNDIYDAVKFFSWQLHLNDSYYEKVKKVAADYIIDRNGKMYIPNLRNSCVIIFEK